VSQILLLLSVFPTTHERAKMADYIHYQDNEDGTTTLTMVIDGEEAIFLLTIPFMAMFEMIMQSDGHEERRDAIANIVGVMTQIPDSPEDEEL
jgi:hypothetical protein